MSKFIRLLIALVIFLSGAVLTPFISLPVQEFGWQVFAQAYEPNSTTLYLPLILKNN